MKQEQGQERQLHIFKLNSEHWNIFELNSEHSNSFHQRIHCKVINIFKYSIQQCNCVTFIEYLQIATLQGVFGNLADYTTVKSLPMAHLIKFQEHTVKKVSPTPYPIKSLRSFWKPSRLYHCKESSNGTFNQVSGTCSKASKSNSISHKQSSNGTFNQVQEHTVKQLSLTPYPTNSLPMFNRNSSYTKVEYKYIVLQNISTLYSFLETIFPERK